MNNTYAISHNDHVFYLHANTNSAGQKELLLSNHTDNNPMWIMNTDIRYGYYFAMDENTAREHADQMAELANVHLAIDEWLDETAAELYMDVDEYVTKLAKSKNHVIDAIPYPDAAVSYTGKEFMNLWHNKQGANQ